MCKLNIYKPSQNFLQSENTLIIFSMILLIDKGITKTEMRKAAGISTSVLAKMGKNESVSMDTLAKITTLLNCGVDDILEFDDTEGHRL